MTSFLSNFEISPIPFDQPLNISDLGDEAVEQLEIFQDVGLISIERNGDEISISMTSKGKAFFQPRTHRSLDDL